MLRLKRLERSRNGEDEDERVGLRKIYFVNQTVFNTAKSAYFRDDFAEKWLTKPPRTPLPGSRARPSKLADKFLNPRG